MNFNKYKFYFSDKSNKFIGQTITANSSVYLCKSLDVQYTPDEEEMFLDSYLPERLNEMFALDIPDIPQIQERQLISSIYESLPNTYISNIITKTDCYNSCSKGMMESFNEYTDVDVFHINKGSQFIINDVIKEIFKGSQDYWFEIYFKCLDPNSNTHFIVNIAQINQPNSFNLLSEEFIEILEYSSLATDFSEYGPKCSFKIDENNTNEIKNNVLEFIQC